RRHTRWPRDWSSDVCSSDLQRRIGSRRLDREYIPAIKAAAPDAPLVVHFHNDLGLGAWNTVMALGSGAEVFTTSVNGIGERTGRSEERRVGKEWRDRWAGGR